MTLLDLKKTLVSKEAVGSVSSRIALHYGILPLSIEGGKLGICVPHDFDLKLKDELKVVLDRREIEIHYARRESIAEAIRGHYGLADEILSRLTDGETPSGPPAGAAEVLDGERDASIARLVNELILDALYNRATDIHLEPFEDRFSVRYRIDGILTEAGISNKMRPLAVNIISRIKIMAQLDIGERRLPQDGRIKVRSAGKELDLRVSVLPTAYGEAAVIRILGSVELLRLDRLGFSPESIAVIRQTLKRPHGIILLTGPTGSGKTTTLYSILKEINVFQRKIITIEDPIEYGMSGVLQMQVKPQIDFTFAKALRSMLRHDPDILMVGEIRDQETAEIAIRSALTGHLVFSTLHTNDAPSSLTRLLEMGIEPYLVASAVELIIAQRLVRTLCGACKRPGTDGFEAVGCRECGGSGYRGRQAIEEVLRMDEDVRQYALKSVPSGVIREHMKRAGESFLREKGMERVRQGVTTAQEIERVC